MAMVVVYLFGEMGDRWWEPSVGVHVTTPQRRWVSDGVRTQNTEHTVKHNERGGGEWEEEGETDRGRDRDRDK